MHNIVLTLRSVMCREQVIREQVARKLGTVDWAAVQKAPRPRAVCGPGTAPTVPVALRIVYTVILHVLTYAVICNVVHVLGVMRF